MIYSKKRRRDITDDGWNRYMRNDEDLPEWFQKDEAQFFTKPLDVSPEEVAAVNERLKEVNVKTIKKAVEAKARKKKRAAQRMEKVKKKAENILENADMGDKEKAYMIKQLYKKAKNSGKDAKKEVKYIVAKKAQAGKRMPRPAGIKGPYKMVDPRMKKDLRGMKRSKGKKKGSKGKKKK